jgi:uracil-DNA glycosylase family 4
MSIRTTLKHPNKYCNGCPLSKACNKNFTYIPTEVHYSRTDENDRPQVDVLIVGEAPGKNEDNQGMPFAGPSGNEIKRALKQAGLSESYAITHSVRCRPVASDSFDKNRPPTKEEIAACSNYLRQDIEQLRPKVVVMLGNTGKEAVAPKEWKSVPIQKLQGEILNSEDITYTATLNPDIFLKKDSYIDKQRFYRHISNVARILSGEQSEDSRKGTTLLLKTEQDVNDLMDSLENEPTESIFVDTETDNLNRVAPNKVATIQFARDNDIGYVIPLDHWQSPFKGEVLERIKRRIAAVFSNPDAPFECWAAHNSKFDYNKICRYFDIVRTAKPMVDTIMLEYLRDENQRRGGDDDGGKMEGGGVAFDLKSMVKDKLGFFHYNNEILDVRKSGSLIDEPLENPDGSISSFTEYAGMDVYVGRRLLCYILKDLDKSGHRNQSWRFANKWGSRITHLLSKMEVNGVFVDKDQLAYLQSDTSPILTRMDEIPEDILSTPEGKAANKLIVQSNSKTKGLKPLFNKVPTVFDIDKKDHRIALLVDTCKLDPLEYGTLKDENGKEVRKFLKKGEIDKGNGVPAINKKFYQQYAGNYFSDLIQEYEGMKKLKSSYLNSVQSFLYDEIIYTKSGPKSNADNLFDGRIHASFHESKTVTGRLAASDPNTQQQPRSDNFAKAMIKSMYGASPGNFILEADYGQAEVRWWAQIAKDKEFAKLFWNMYEITQEYERNPTPEMKLRVKNECDIHRQVSAAMNRIDISTVTSDQRQAAKGLCVSLGTLIRTEEGLIPIEEAISNWNGSLKLETRLGVEEANHAFEVTVNRTIKITTGRGLELQGRPEHPILAWRNCTLQYVELQDLKETDHIILRREAKLWPSKQIELSPYVWGKTGVEPNHCTMPNHLDVDLARLIGYITSEGDATNEKSLSISNTDLRIIEDIRNILNAKFSKEAYSENTKVRKEGELPLTTFTLSTSATRFLRLTTLVNFDIKEVSPQIFKSPKAVVVEFLRGYTAGDGSSDRKRIKITSASEKLLKQVQILLLDLGLVSTRYSNYLTLEGKELDLAWNLFPSCKLSILTDNSSVVSEELIRFANPSDKEEILSNGYFLDTLETKEEDLTEGQKVYDFTVPGSHSFITQGLISHNTFGTIFGMAASSLARVVNCTEQEAQKLMYDLTNRFERAGGWLEYIEDFAIDNGYVISPYGRVRHLAHLIGTQESTLRRLARNSPIQGSASDTTALAAWCLQDWIERNNKPYLIWNVVHDAVYMEAPLELDVLEECLYQVKRCMSTDIGNFLKEEFGIDLIVPLVVDFKVGLRSGHCKSVDPTTNLKELVKDLKEYDNRLNKGEKWWQIVTKNEITKLEKEISALEKDKPEGFEKKIEKLLKVKNKHLAQISKT